MESDAMAAERRRVVADVLLRLEGILIELRELNRRAEPVVVSAAAEIGPAATEAMRLYIPIVRELATTWDHGYLNDAPPASLSVH